MFTRVNNVYRFCGNTNHGFSHKQKGLLTRIAQVKFVNMYYKQHFRSNRIWKGITSNLYFLSLGPFKFKQLQ